MDVRWSASNTERERIWRQLWGAREALINETETARWFGELSALLDQPHTADVHAVETSQYR